MENKEIQKQRMREYFIKAAKEIIREEGIKGLTARKIGQRSGYSYATIYNYFKDLNTLMFYCAFEFLNDCYRYMENYKKNNTNPREQLIAYASAYFTYFTHNSEMFQLVFLEDLGDVPKDLMLIDNESKPSVGLLLRQNLIECYKEGYIEELDIAILQDLISSSIHGKLMFFLKGRNIEKLDDMILSIKKEIEYLIKEKR